MIHTNGNLKNDISDDDILKRWIVEKNTDIRCKFSIFVNPVVQHAEWTNNQKRSRV